MKKLIILFMLIPLISFCQNITKKELVSIVKSSIKINHSSTVDYQDIILVADNTDSIFFNKKQFIIYTSRLAPSENSFCRRIEFKFIDKNYVELQDCQNCNEPSSCIVSDEKNYYYFNILKVNNDIFLVLSNKFEVKKYKFLNAKRYENNSIKEFELKLM